MAENPTPEELKKKLQYLMQKEQELKRREQQVFQKERESQGGVQQQTLVDSGFDGFLKGNQSPQETPKIQELSKELEEIKNMLRDRETKESQRERKTAEEEARQYIRTYVDNNEGFDLIKATESYDQVFNEILETYNKTGQTISEEDAAKRVNERLESYVDRLVELDSVKQKIKPKDEEAHQASTEEPTPSTITNEMAQERASETQETQKTPSIASLAEKYKQLQNKEQS